MSVRFIIGRAGSGKTHWCFQKITEELRAIPWGPAVFWIVPKQATFQAERELVCESGVPGFTRARVVSFERLAREILIDCGGSAVPEISAYGRQMILGLLLRKHEHELEFFKSVARQSGLAARLDATFGELERCGKTVDDLEKLVRDLEQQAERDGESAALLAKMRDLHRIYAAYCAYLGQERLDPHRRLQQVLGYLEKCSLLRGAKVFVDGFLDFTDYERKALTSIAKVCGDLNITILADPASPAIADVHRMPGEMGLFHRTELAFRKLHFAMTGENVVVDEIVRLGEVKRFEGPALMTIERSLFENADRIDQTAQREDPKASDGSITLIESPNRRAEIDSAAASVRELLRQGYRQREIAVLSRDVDDYSDLIDASFREHAIDYFIDRRRSIGHHPLLQFMRSVLAIAAGDWPHEALMTIAKCGLAELSSQEADELENYVLLHRVRGAMWGQTSPWSLKRVKTLGTEDSEPSRRERAEQIAAARADALRRKLVDPLRPFLDVVRPGILTLRSIVVALFELFDRFSIRRTIAQWIEANTQANDLEQRGEHEQVWAEGVELFDQMVDLLGDENVTLPEFVEILESGLETFDLGLTPPTLDQVLVGQIDRTRSPRVKVAILLGMNEGQFPRSAREDSILSDPERKSLRERNVDVDADSERRLLDENLLGYLAFTRASQRLILTRSICDEAGRSVAPSIFWRELRSLCPNLTVTETCGQADRITTPRQLVTHLMRWVRQTKDDAGLASSAFDPALYQWFAAHECCDDAIDVMRYRAWKALDYSNSATLSPQTAKMLWPSPLTASVSELETFAACPFKHFVTYGLNLEPREEADPTAIDLGNVYHETLEKLVARILKDQLDFKTLPPELARSLIHSCAHDVGESLRDELMMSSARNRHLLRHIEETLAQVTASQTAMAERGGFLPAYTELSFGRDGSPLPPLLVSTPAGNQLRLRGKIDRVDLLSREGAFAIVDYKMAGRTVSLQEVYHGLTMQLLAYLLVIQAHGETLTGKPLTPAAGLYVKLLRGLEKVDHPDDGIDPADATFHLRHKPRGIIDGQFAKDFDHDLQPGTDSKVISARINKDGNFSAKSDIATSDQLWALLGHVEEKLAELTDQILSGRIDVAPYWLNGATPCARCDFKSVCRFEPGINHYTHVPSLSKDEVIALVTGKTQ